MLDKKFWNKVGPKIRDAYRTHIFHKGKDVNGKPFKRYSPKYGERKRAGLLRRQDSSSKNKRAPVVTTDLLRDFGTSYNTTSNQVKMGWSIYGKRVEALNKMGRLLTTKSNPLPKDTIKLFESEAVKYIKKRLKDMFPKNMTIDLTKK